LVFLNKALPIGLVTKRV